MIIKNPFKKLFNYFTVLLVFWLLLWIRSSTSAFVPSYLSQWPYSWSVFAGNVSAPSGDVNWSNANNVLSSDNNRATVTILNSSDVSNYLRATGFNFTIPPGSTINWIQISIEKSEGNMNSATIFDNIVRLVKNNVVTGDNKATNTAWSTTDAITTYGGSWDLWGTTWTSSDINNANFWLVLSVGRTSGWDEQARVDHITITVTYTPDTIKPTATVSYSTTSLTNQNVIAYLTWWSEILTWVNSYTHTFTGNWDYIFTFSDLAWNTWSVTASVSNIDKDAPVLSLPDDVLMEATTPDGEIINYEASATDEHPANPTINCIPPSGSTFTLWDTTVTCTSTDDAENTATGTFHIVIQDTINPEIVAPEDQIFEASGPLTTPVLVEATATDSWSNPVVTYAPHDFSLGTTEVTWTATDMADNEATTTSNVTIVDTTPPTITLHGNSPFDMFINTEYSVLNPNDYSVWDLVDWDNITGNVVVTVTWQDFDNTVLGPHVITYSATDLSGNISTVTRTVNVVDRNKPIIYRQWISPITIERGVVYEDAWATAIDRDWSDITSLIYTVNPISTGTLVGSYTITYNVTGLDLWTWVGTNIADQAKRIVNLVDTIKPTAAFTYSPDWPTNGSVTATIVPDEPVTITNNEWGTTYSFTENWSFTFEFVDPSGNTGSATATVEGIDKVDPTIVSVEAIDPNTVKVVFDEDLQNNLDGHHPSTFDFDVKNSNSWDLSYGISGVTYTGKIVTLTLTDTIKSGDMPRLYIYSEETSLVDLAGNYFNNGSSYDTGVMDKIAPVLTLSGDATIDLNVGWTYTEQGAICADVVDEICGVVLSGTVNVNIPGTYTITYTAEDEAGNAALPVTRTINVHAIGGWWGGWGYYYPNTGGTGTVVEIVSSGEVQNDLLSGWTFSQEFIDAYQFAFNNGITTMPAIEDAKMTWNLIRSEMAKMLVNYAIHILGETPDTSLACDFTDISNQSLEMKDYIIKACQLWIMWINTKKFMPNAIVTRSRFWSALSRLLYHTPESGKPFYLVHLNLLRDNWIITDTNPNLLEVRAYVMIMLMRTSAPY